MSKFYVQILSKIIFQYISEFKKSLKILTQFLPGTSDCLRKTAKTSFEFPNLYSVSFGRFIPLNRAS